MFAPSACCPAARLLLLVARRRWPRRSLARAGAPPPRPTCPPSARRCTRRARRAATCWTARGSSASTRPATGLAQRLQRSTGTAGWTPVTVPNAWNARTTPTASLRRRRRLVPQGLPAAQRAKRLAWVVRFESVNYRARVWLNGQPIGTNTGAYLPFEFRLPAGAQARRRPTAWSIRVDNRRLPTDFPPAGLVPRGDADRRLVELRRHPARGLPAPGRRGRPGGPCCVHPARPLRDLHRAVTYSVTIRNVRAATRRVTRDAARFGGAPVRPRHPDRAGRRARRSRGSLRCRNPRAVVAGVAVPLRRAAHRSPRAGATVQRYALQHRHPLDHASSTASCCLNGQPLQPARRRRCTRTPPTRARRSTTPTATGTLALDQRARARRSSARHYPLHPYFQEQADRSGMLLWSEIPVYRSRRSTWQARARPRAGGRASCATTSSPTGTTRRSSSGRSATS